MLEIDINVKQYFSMILVIKLSFDETVSRIVLTDIPLSILSVTLSPAISQPPRVLHRRCATSYRT